MSRKGAIVKPTCPHCGRPKAFAKSGRMHPYCREHLNEFANKWSRENRDKALSVRRQANYMRKFGLEYGGYDRLFREQEGRCALCQRPGRPAYEREGELPRLVVDHDHGTNRIRGLLCNACNQSIPVIWDDRAWRERTIAYISSSDEQVRSDSLRTESRTAP